MFCKKCGAEIKDGNLCPECGTKFVTNKSKILSMLLAIAVIGFTIFLGINGDKEIVGYPIITIYITVLIILCIITVIWTYTKKKPQISINTLKQDFKKLIETLKGVNDLSDNYRNIVLVGYISIFLLFISLFSNLIANVFYGGLNGNGYFGALTIITILLGSILYFYSWIKMLIKLKKINKNSSLRNHFYIIWGFFAIFLLVISLF